MGGCASSSVRTSEPPVSIGLARESVQTRDASARVQNARPAANQVSRELNADGGSILSPTTGPVCRLGTPCRRRAWVSWRDGIQWRTTGVSCLVRLVLRPGPPDGAGNRKREALEHERLCQCPARA